MGRVQKEWKRKMRNRNTEWERKREDNRNVAKILWADVGLCANNLTSAIMNKTKFERYYSWKL